MSERLDQLISGAQTLKAWDGTNETTWNAQHNSKSLAGILRAFRESRQSLVRSFDTLPEEMVERAAQHPRLNKPMRVIDLAEFIAEHDDYHLARISSRYESDLCSDWHCRSAGPIASYAKRSRIDDG